MTAAEVKLVSILYGRWMVESKEEAEACARIVEEAVPYAATQPERDALLRRADFYWNAFP